MNSLSSNLNHHLLSIHRFMGKYHKRVKKTFSQHSATVYLLSSIHSLSTVPHSHPHTVASGCFRSWAFILPVLEYCSPVWMSAATFHLSLLDRVVSQVGRLSGGSVTCDLWHRSRVASLRVFFKIDSLVDYPVRGLFPAQYVLRRPTRGALAAPSRSFEMPKSRTVQFSRSFVLSCVR